VGPMTKGAFFEKRTWCFQNFCSCLPKGPVPRRPHHRLNQMPSPGGDPRTPLPSQPSDIYVTVQAGCMAPGGPSMPWVRSACPVCAMSVPGPFLPWAGPQEEPGGVEKGLRGATAHSCGYLVSHRFTCLTLATRPLGGRWVWTQRGGVGCASLPSLCQASAGGRRRGRPLLRELI
jgi:hypothetical protein